MIHFLTIGTVLGLSAGFAPGPLLTLVISETLQHDIKSGVKVALAPIITDLPIIILTLLILSKLSNFHNILGIISLAGGLFILFMGYKNLRTKRVEINFNEIKSKSFAKGVLANALSPHPYLFWFSVGAPTMTKAMSQDIGAPTAFIISFYFFLVGSKIMLAILIGKSKFLLSGRAYIFTMRFLGLVLCVLAIVLFHDGLNLLKII
ncbi:MAG: LysE family translocator [Desulfobacteraceae bacterium]|nr:MAG: LysE family translocator [Desulfobacteraceae bacterium]